MESSRCIDHILNRDQRTAKLKFKCDREVTDSSRTYDDATCSGRHCNSIININKCHCHCPNRTRDKSHATRRRRSFSNKSQSLKNVLIVSVWLSLVGLPGSRSAPTNMSTESEPFWINPCGLENFNIDGSQTATDEKELIEHINTVRWGAIIQANELLEKFAQQRFSMNASTLHERLKNEYSWIDRLPKGLNETVSQEHLNSRELSTILLDMYTHLQKIAVGLERMIQDTDPRDELYTTTSAAKGRLKAVLCEFQEAMLALGLSMRPDVTENAMPAEDRNADYTKRKTRDWMLLREYVNALEYLEQVFKHMLKSQ